MAVGAYQVTFDEWEQCEREGVCPHADEVVTFEKGFIFNPLKNWGRGRQPVSVSWNDTQKYLVWLNRKTDKMYRLLGEAEWEYACLGGMVSTAYCGGENSEQSVGNSGRARPSGGSEAAERLWSL